MQRSTRLRFRYFRLLNRSACTRFDFGGITGVHPFSVMSSRIQSASSPRSAMTSVLFGRSSRSRSAIGASCRLPAESSICSGKPKALTRRCSLLVNPPRLRPIQASPTCFFGGSLLAHAHRCGIDKLDLASVRLDNRTHQPVPHDCLSPAIEAIVDRRVRTIPVWQISPR